MSIKANFLRSSGWVLLGTGADNVVQFVIFAVLARLLSLDELGVVAFAIVFIEVGRVFVNGGLPDAVIQRAEWDPLVGSVCFTMNMLLAVVAAVLLAGIGGPLMEHYYRAGSGAIVAALSLMFVLEALRAVHAAKLRREFQYRSLAIRSTLAGLVGGTGAIALAYAGFGAWALVFQRLSMVAVMTVATWMAAGWRPQIILRRDILAEIAPFSTRVTLSKTIDILNQRIPDLVVGLLLGPAAVALYRVGGRALDAITKLAIQPFQDAAFAAFSRVGTREGIGEALRRVTRTVALFTFPVFIGTATIARELIILLFGAKYEASGPVMSTLALAGVAGTLSYFSTTAYIAAAEGRASVRANSFAATSNLFLCAGLCLPFGPLGAAIGNGVTQMMLVPLNLAMLRRYLMLSPRRVLAGIGAPFFAAAAMGVILAIFKHYALAGQPPAIVIGVVGVLGAVLYPALMLLFGREYLHDLLEEMASILPAGIVKRFGRQRPASASANTDQ